MLMAARMLTAPDAVAQEVAVYIGTEPGLLRYCGTLSFTSADVHEFTGRCDIFETYDPAR